MYPIGWKTTIHSAESWDIDHRICQKGIIEMQNKISFKMIAAITALCIVLCSTLTLCGCGRKLKSNGMHIIDDRAGISYQYLPNCFEPAERASKAYASLEIAGSSQNLYSIKGLDTSEWLCTEWGDVLYAGNDSISTIEDFEPSLAYLCDIGDSIVISLAVITDDDLNTVLTDWSNGDTVSKPLNDPDETYLIKFESTKYSGIYYSMSVLVYGEDVYICNKYENQRCVKDSGVLGQCISESR